MSVGVWVGVSLAGVALLLALSPACRRIAFKRVLFPLGYCLYATQQRSKQQRGEPEARRWIEESGGQTGRAREAPVQAVFMSSASKPAAPHTRVDRPTVDGEGDSEVTVVPVPLLGDNYSYLLLHTASRTAAVVDPADPEPVMRALEQHPDYKLHTILTTHKHWDHAGGNLVLKEKFPDVQIAGGAGDGVAGATVELGTGGLVHMNSPHFTARVLQTPCHTRGHVLYRVGSRLLFTGDTLFSAGCGKFFEGDAEQMYSNLVSTIGALPDDTLVFPGHEYTQSNLEFATWVEPDNEAARERLEWAREQREQQRPTIPTTLAQEKAFNPFMRVHEAGVVARVSRLLGMQATEGGAEKAMGVRVMDALRTLKNDNAHKKK